MRPFFLIFCLLILAGDLMAQKKPAPPVPAAPAVVKPAPAPDIFTYCKPVRWRDIGPYRGGRSVAACGVPGQPMTYYMGTTGGGVWKTADAGITWTNISDGYLKTGSVGAVAVAPADPAVVYVGMGEHAPRGVMTSYGDGVYKSTDAGATWQHLGLALTRQIAGICIHPTQPDLVYVAAQGALNGPGADRGVYKSADGGKTWRKVLYVDENTGCSELVMDPTNPRILYAAMWDHRRLPWQVRSGGPGSGLYKSTDAGETWTRLTGGLPDALGKMSIAVCPSLPQRVYALIESDTEQELGGLFVSHDGGTSFDRISGDHRLTQRAWYYIEMAVDPLNENTLYVLNSPALKSIDGGKTWDYFDAPHGDYHQLWINPRDSKNMIMAHDGGATISFNGGKTWSSEDNQPTGQFYRVNTDNLFPYHIYGGQQDNTSVRIASRNLMGGSITEREWTYSAGGESAFLAFDPDNPTLVMGGSYQGTIGALDMVSGEEKYVMVTPVQYQALQPKDMKYRFNWNAPIIYSRHEPGAFYHAANVIFKTTDKGMSWTTISPDLTRNDKSKQGVSGVPYTNEGAGGENYGTISYLAESPHEAGVLYAGSDDGLVHLTRDGGKTWTNITPPGMGETLVNCIEVSPHDKGTVYIATTRYKVNDFRPGLYKTTDYGKTWSKIGDIPDGAYTRCIREDQVRKGLLFCGTETGLYVSFDGGQDFLQLQLGLPVTPVTDLRVHQGDLIAATMGRGFWILDDLHMLRQLDPALIVADKLHLYTPEDTWRLSSWGPDELTPASRAGSTSGANPPNGVVYYYQLPQTLTPQDRLTLSIYDLQGQLIRTYDAQADSSFAAYPGGPEAEPVLPAKPGLNRFVWDLRHETLPGVPEVFIEGSYAGRRVVPGTYRAVLSLNGQSVETRSQILPHPRIQATAAAYAAQDSLLRQVDEGCTEIHLAILRMRKVSAQISSFMTLTQAQPALSGLRQQGQGILDKITRWENNLVQNKARSNDDIINYVNKLSAEYIFLRWELDTNIPGVTRGQRERFQELSTIWNTYRMEMQGILEQDIPAFNRACRQADIQQILIP
ncbi:MAG: glycosyl hydrolase [Bacteroidia bacterium]|nr:glycosyl hydrolase [Bacteroidia bacterium]